jgi:hypothetical protein
VIKAISDTLSSGGFAHGGSDQSIASVDSIASVYSIASVDFIAASLQAAFSRNASTCVLS